VSKWLALLSDMRRGELNQSNNQIPAGRPAEEPAAAQAADKMIDSFNSPHPQTAIPPAEAAVAAEPRIKLIDSFNSPHPGTHHEPDPDLLLAHVRVHGPTTYGAAATDLGIGASRAWRAEAELVAVGLVRLDHLGRMTIVEEVQP